MDTTTKVCWVIERHIFEEEYELELIEEIKTQGHTVITLDILKGKNPLLDDYNSKRWCIKQPCIFRGSINLTKYLRQSVNWYPGIIYSLSNFDCSVYYTYWGKWMLNNDYSLKSFKETIRCVKEETFFLRPNSGDKLFNGGVYTYKEMCDLRLHPETLVLTAKAETIHAEYRFVVSNKTIISGCHYKQNSLIGFRKNTKMAKEYLESVLLQVNWEPDEIYIVDLCYTAQGFAILEMNSFSCSNLYTCPPKKIVEVASSVAISMYEEINMH